MKRSLVIAMFALAACSSNSEPAGPPPSLVTPLMLQPPPIYSLLGYRDRLELDTDQIVRLDSIATGLRDTNRVLINELEEKSSLTRNQTGRLVGEDGKEVLESIRENNRGAAEAVGRLMTTAQQETTCELFRLDQDDRNRGRRSNQIRGADPAAADSIWRALEARVWPWCGNTRPDSTTSSNAR